MIKITDTQYPCVCVAGIEPRLETFYAHTLSLSCNLNSAHSCLEVGSSSLA